MREGIGLGSQSPRTRYNHRHLCRPPCRRLHVPCRRRISHIKAKNERDNTDSKNSSLGDELLDFMYAGKKLRKWYGQEGQVLPKDGDPVSTSVPSDDHMMEEARDGVLVVFPDEYPMAEQVVLQLILQRARVLAVVKDIKGASSSYGSYVDVVQGDSSGIQKALRRVNSVVLCGGVNEEMMRALTWSRVPHVVLLSGVTQKGTGGRGGLMSLFLDPETRALEDPSREEKVKQLGVEYTICRVGTLTNEEGGRARVEVVPGGYGEGEMPREDAARALAQASIEQTNLGVVSLRVVPAAATAADEEAQQQ